MSKPIKVKIKQVIKESLCLHKDITYRVRLMGDRDYILCECKKCGKRWTE